MHSPTTIIAALLTTYFMHPSIAPAQEVVPPSPEFLPSAAALETFINAEMKAKETPGLAIAVVREGHVVWAKGFGLANPEKQLEATAETRFPIGSVSKLPTALLCLQLAREGKLNLDDPVTKHVPTFNPKNPFGTPVTIRHLLAHCSGIVREPPAGNYFFPGAVTPKQMVDSLNDTAIVYKPGTQYKYSNSALSLAGYIVEVVENKTFADVAAERIFRKLGMSRSSFRITDAIRPEVAQGQGWTRFGKTFPVPLFDYIALAPAGGATASVNDMARFIEALCPVPGEETPFHRDDLNAAFTRQFPNINAERTYGLGFVLTQFQGRRQVRHGGDVNGCVTELTVLPDDKLGVVVCANKQSANMLVRRIAEAALGQLLAVRDGKPLPRLESSLPLSPSRDKDRPPGRPRFVSPDEAKWLEGRYVHGDDVIDIEAQGERAYLVPASGGPLKEIRLLNGSLIVDDALSYGTTIKPQDRGLLIDGKQYDRVGDPVRASPSPPPSPAPEKWLGLIGEYGPEFNVLHVLEKDGRLHLLIEWFFLYPLTEESPDHFRLPNSGLYPGEPVVFERKNGKATAVVLAGLKFDRRKLDGEDGATFKIKPVRPIDELRKEALASTPPAEQGEFLKPDLVNLAFFDPTIKFDIRYAGDNNFMGAPLYTSPGAYFQRPAAEALARAHRNLARHGFGILIHDTYRPWFVTKMFWEATPPAQHVFVADPSKGSRHNRGCAADITLYDLKTGKPVDMVSGYDEFSDRAYPDYPGGTSLQRWRRKLLRDAMESEGFTVYEAEWWHFDYKDWRKYPILNKRFEELGAPRRKTTQSNRLADPSTNQLPRSWNLKEIEDAAPPYPSGGGKVYVLAWKITEDNRPRRVEQCLVLKVLDEPSERGRWCLSHLARVPNDELMLKWRLASTHIAYEPGHKLFPGFEHYHVKRFKDRPTNRDIYDSFAIDEVNWSFEMDEWWHFVGSMVCDENWNAAIGERPTRFFNAEKWQLHPIDQSKSNAVYRRAAASDKQEVPLPPPMRIKVGSPGTELEFAL